MFCCGKKPKSTKKVNAQNITLTYFNFPGRAETARICFSIGGIEFTDKIIDFEQFGQMKAQDRFKFGQVPILDVNGVQYAQSGAINRYAAELAGLQPKCIIEQMEVDQAYSHIDDIFATMYSPSGIKDEAEKQRKFKEICDGLLKQQFQSLDKILESNKSGYLAGKSLSVADVFLYVIIMTHKSGTLGVPKDFYQQFPKVKKLYETLSKNKQIQAYEKKKQQQQKNPPKKQKSIEEITLQYFGVPARAETARLCFHLGDVPFKDEILDFDQFGKMKAQGKFKFGQVPVLTVNGKQYAQSGAINRFAAEKAGLNPTCILEQMEVEQAYCQVDDILNTMFVPYMIQDKDEKLQKYQEISEGTLKAMFTSLDTILEQNSSGFLGGKALSVADVYLYSTILTIQSGMFEGICKKYHESFPQVNKLFNNIAQNPKIQAYNNKKK